MSVQYLVPIQPKGTSTGACCGTSVEKVLSLKTTLSDDWFLLKDGESIDIGNRGRNMCWEDFPKATKAERMARKDPDHDWRLWYISAFHGGTYQRQEGKWVLVEQNEGYA